LFSPGLKDRLADVRTPFDTASEFPPPALEDGKCAREFEGWSPLSRAQYLEAMIFLPQYLLSSQGDRMSMANSVEGRYLLLDHRLGEYGCGLAPHLKLSGLNEKHVLKHAARGLVPDFVLQREKQPYRAPVAASFFPGGQPLDWVAEMLCARSLQQTGYFSASATERLLLKRKRWGKLGETEAMGLTGVLSTQLLHHRFVSDYSPPTPLSASDDVKVVCRGPIQRSRLPLSRGPIRQMREREV
jgi:asparagine synthase (glutamine-hydrolysing)